MTNIASSIFNRLQDLVVASHNPTSAPPAPTANLTPPASSNLLNSITSRLPASIHGSSHSTAVVGSLSHVTAPAVLSNPADRKLVEKCYRAMESVIRLCRQPALNVKKSPPCILDILPDISRTLDAIFKADPNVLQGTNGQCQLYLQLFISNLTLKCKQTMRLFKRERPEVMADVESQSRRSLTMKALIFSHMLFELQAEFPAASNHKFLGTNYRVTKKEAAEFWRTSFADRTLVPWEEFRCRLSAVHPIGVGIETQALKSTIDLTCNDHISNFEFDVFTRLFHPWGTLLKNWQLLAVTHPAYVAFLTYEEVKTKLQAFINKPGSYVFRLSCTKLGQWAIGYVAPDKKIYQTIPQNKSLIQSLVDGSREGFYLYPNGRPKNVDLSHALQSASPEGRLQVSREQYAIYCEMGTTFEMCKICDERNKNVRLEPCSHLLCRPCLSSWQESIDGTGSTCPFCRCEIKGTETVVIESFRRPSASAAKASVSDWKASRSGELEVKTSLLTNDSSANEENLMSFSPSASTNSTAQPLHNAQSIDKDAPPEAVFSHSPPSMPPPPPPPVPPKRNNPSPLISSKSIACTTHLHHHPSMTALSSSSLSNLSRAATNRINTSVLATRIPLSPVSSLSLGQAGRAGGGGQDARKSSSEPLPAAAAAPDFDPFAATANPFSSLSNGSNSQGAGTSTSSALRSQQLPDFADFATLEFRR